MRFLIVSCVLLLIACGCTTKTYSWGNGPHVKRHITCIIDDFHNLHKDIDRTVFGIWEMTEEERESLKLGTSEGNFE